MAVLIRFNEAHETLVMIQVLLENNTETIVRSELTLLDFIDFCFENQESVGDANWFKKEQIWNIVGLDVTAEQVVDFVEPIDIFKINAYTPMTIVNCEQLFTGVEEISVNMANEKDPEVIELLAQLLDQLAVMDFDLLNEYSHNGKMTIIKSITEDGCSQTLFEETGYYAHQLSQAAADYIATQDMTILWMFLSALNEVLLDDKSKTALMTQIQRKEMQKDLVLADNHILDFYIREASNIKNFLLPETVEEVIEETALETA